MVESAESIDGMAIAQRHEGNRRYCGIQSRWSGFTTLSNVQMAAKRKPRVLAWVRSLAPNLERMLLTRLLTDSSVVES